MQILLKFWPHPVGRTAFQIVIFTGQRSRIAGSWVTMITVWSALNFSRFLTISSVLCRSIPAKTSSRSRTGEFLRSARARATDDAGLPRGSRRAR